MGVVIAVVTRTTEILTSLEWQNNWIRTKKWYSKLPDALSFQHYLLPSHDFQRKETWMIDRTNQCGCLGVTGELGITTVSRHCGRMCQRTRRWKTDQVGRSCNKSKLIHHSHTFTCAYTHFILHLSVPREATWFSSYLSDRHNSTSINNSKSAKAPVITTSSRLLLLHMSYFLPLGQMLHGTHVVLCVITYVTINLSFYYYLHVNKNIDILSPALSDFFFFF